MVRKIELLFHTIRYLKLVQVFYQVKYRLLKPRLLINYDRTYDKNSLYFPSFRESPPVYQSYLGNNEFVFLNLEVKFNSEIDWDFQGNGKLWNYNLQYCQYLLQEDISPAQKTKIALSLYNWLDSGDLLLEPYPASLRIIAMIRLFSQESEKTSLLFPFVHAELDFLSKKIEYHLLGNHLLENGFALLMGGAFFSNRKWIKLGEEILEGQLQEQILPDGAHFELSPMYHQIIFFRLLELIDWYSNWHQKQKRIEGFLIDKAAMMRSWLEKMTFRNGEIPHFNDSAEGISFSTKWLTKYADNLGIASKALPLSASGYRSISRDSYECKIDFSQLGPSYQPGHAHADALSFILYYKDKPVFVEVGTSTYEINANRDLQRATRSHNTVEFNNLNQSQVYGGFRVGKRAVTNILKDEEYFIEADHNGYFKTYGIKHKRGYKFKEKGIEISDQILGSAAHTSIAYFHLHPDVEIIEEEGCFKLKQIGIVKFDNYKSIRTQSYDLSIGFNRSVRSTLLSVSFADKLETIFLFDDQA